MGLLDSLLESGVTMTENVQPTLSDPSSSFMERRKEYRLNIRVPIRVAGVHPQTLEEFDTETVTHNVSRFGAGFELSHGLARVGSFLDLSMGDQFEAKCRVIWIQESDDGKDLIGAEFVAVTGQWVLYN